MVRARRLSVLACLAVLLCLGAALDPYEEFGRILKWEKPADYPPPTLEGMDVATLSALLDSGNLQWYMPRPEPEDWEAVVGLKIHAPPEAVWDVITDYPALCEIMPLTYLECETEYRRGKVVKNNQKGQTTIVRFAYKYDIIDMVTEDPPYHHNVRTIEGLEDRELDTILVPVGNGSETLLFMRYHLDIEALGLTMKAMLMVAPMIEPPTAVGAANYHSRAYRNEAERRAGYEPAPQPAPLDTSGLDVDTLRLIQQRAGGLLRETPEGKIIDVVTWTFIKTPPGRVWEVLTDFEHYQDTFPGTEMRVEKREGDTVTVFQKGPSMSVLIFRLDGFDMPSRYILDPPRKITYRCFEGMYEGSHGSYRLVPLPGLDETLLFHQAGFNLERDQSLTARIFKSGAFPLENMLFMLGAQTSVEHVKEEAEERESAQN